MKKGGEIMRNTAKPQIGMEGKWRSQGKEVRKKGMTIKEWLKQAITIDRRIDANLEQITYLRRLATRATSTIKISETEQRNRVADCIMKIRKLEEAINDDIESLVELKSEIKAAIDMIDREEYRRLLELRYICGMSWEKVAETMNYTLRNTHYVHGNSLKKLYKIQGRINI